MFAIFHNGCSCDVSVTFHYGKVLLVTCSFNLCGSQQSVMVHACVYVCVCMHSFMCKPVYMRAMRNKFFMDEWITTIWSCNLVARTEDLFLSACTNIFIVKSFQSHLCFFNWACMTNAMCSLFSFVNMHKLTTEENPWKLL